MAVTARVTVRNPSGLHARPLALFVRLAGPFASSIRVRDLSRDAQREADAKSILALMTLGVSRDHEIELSAEGPDAAEAVAALRAAVEEGLGESLAPPGPTASAPPGSEA